MTSVIIPAHNEDTVIGRLLQGLTRAETEAQRADSLDIVVVCNGCSDRTAEIARAFGEPVHVIETEVASKSHALRLGDEAARSFPRTGPVRTGARCPW